MNQIKKFTQKDRYGNTTTYEFEAPVKPVDQTALMKAAMEQMQSGMQVPQMEMSMGIPEMHPGEPKGSDTVPAWLTPGEFVMNAEAVREFGPQIEQMNEHGRAIQRAQGGTIPGYSDGGLIPAPGVSNPETDLGLQYHARGGMTPMYAQEGSPVYDFSQPINTLDQLSAITGVPVENALAQDVQSNLPTMPQFDDLGVDLSGYGEGDRSIPEVEGTTGLSEAVGTGLSALTGGILSTEAARQAQTEEQELANAQAAAQSVVPQEDQKDVAEEQNEEVPKPYSIREGEGGIPVIRQTEEQKNKLDDLMGSAENVATAGQAAAAEEPGMFEKAYDFIRGNLNNFLQNTVGGDFLGGLEDFAGDAFEYGLSYLGGEEGLKKLAFQYLGSRALGYDHHTSLNWTGKQLQAGIAANQKAQAEITKQKLKADREFEQFKRKENYKEAMKAGVTFDSTTPVTIQDRETGRQMKVFAGTDANGNKAYYTVKDGKPVPVNTLKYETDEYNIKNTKAYNQRLKDTMNTSVDIIKELRETLSFPGEDGKPVYRTAITPEVAGREAAKFALENGIAPEDVASLLEGAMYEAAEDGKKARDIRPYLENAIVRTGAGDNKDLFIIDRDENGVPKYVDGKKFAQITKRIKERISQKGSKANATAVANRYFEDKVPKWNAIGPEQQARWDRIADKERGENGFLMFIMHEMKLSDKAPKAIK